MSQTIHRLIKERRVLSEGSVLKLDYVVGHKFYYKGGLSKQIQAFGLDWKDGTVVEKVPPVKNPAGVEDRGSEYEAYLEGPNGKILHIKADTTSVGSFTHVKESGSPPSGAELEELIIKEYNDLNGTDTDPSVVETYEKFGTQHHDIAKKIAKGFNAKVGGKQLVHTGQGGLSKTLGKHWKAAGASNTTPKTDIANSSFSERISLKKEGGSRSASPEKKEAIALVNAALELAVEQDKTWAKNLVKSMGTKMETLISTENASDLKKRYIDGDRDAAAQNWKTVDNANRELSQELTDIFAKDKKVGGVFAKCVLYEASTGAAKFNGKDQAPAANYLAKFSLSRKVEYHEMKNPDSPVIASNAEKLKPYVSFKKGGSASAAYSAFQLALKNEYTPTTATSIILSELNNIDGFAQFLTEDMLEEGVLDTIKRAGNWAKEMGQNAWKNFQKALKAAMKKIYSYLKKIASAGKRFFQLLLNFFGIEIDNVKDVHGISSPDFHLLN